MGVGVCVGGCCVCGWVGVGVCVVMIVRYFDLQLPMQSVSIINKDVISIPAHGEMYSIQQYVIKFVSDLPQDGCFCLVLRFTPLIKLTTTI